ncbi:MAG: histidine phosphatase family protein [Abditibacteriota bacterium]|nr:histidine phosphatase family protein [Abditibacteriota bacterium]
MELYIVRHGETTANRTHILQGMSYPSYLNEIGREQAISVGKRLKEVKFNHIYTSDLIRAKTTAELIRNELGVKPPLTETKALRERNYGDFEGHTWAEVRKFYNTNAQRSVVEAPPNGESLYDVRDRINAFIKDLKEKYSDENILLVTHHGAVMMLCVCLLDLGFEHHKKFQFDNGSVTVFQIGDEYNKLKLCNDTCHILRKSEEIKIS